MRSAPTSILVCGAALLLFSVDLQTVCGADDPLSITAVKVGIDGRYKSGYWTPVRIELRGGSQPFQGEIQIVVPDGDGVATRFTWQDQPAIQLAAGESHTIVRIVKLGRSQGTIDIELRDGEDVVARRKVSAAELPPPIPADREWLVAYSSDIDVSDALGRKSRTGINTEVCQLSGVDQLPDHWLGLEAVDTILVTTSDSKKIDAFSHNQLKALREWILMGGRLVWSVGQNGADLVGEKGRLAPFAPGKFRELTTLRNFASLESYSGSAQRLELRAPGTEGIPLTVLEEPRGVVELVDVTTSGTRPLIVRSPFGFGQTVFVGFDLELPKVADWEGRFRILARVLQISPGQAERRRGEVSNTQVARFGYQDMVGQLRGGLDQFPGVRLVALWWVAALVSVYIVLIGPVDYFLLRDFLRRMTLTWVTFPLVTVLFIGLVLWLGPRWKGNQVLTNQIDLVDVDAATSTFRATTWAHVYSPHAATYQMQCTPSDELTRAAILHGNVLAWHGLPGTGLGGLNTAAAAPPAIDEYHLKTTRIQGNNIPGANGHAIQTTVEGIPIQVAATKSVLGRWWGETRLQGETKLTVDADGLPRGEIANPLPIELSDCAVYFGNWAFRLDATRGILAPGQTTRIDNERALNLQWRLTGRRVIDTKEVGTPWDQQTLEIPRVLGMMMFHSAAGGDSYTQLVNRYQPYVDLSQHLLLGQAILVGRAPTAASKLMINDSHDESATKQWTYYRVLFPVSKHK